MSLCLYMALPSYFNHQIAKKNVPEISIFKISLQSVHALVQQSSLRKPFTWTPRKALEHSFSIDMLSTKEWENKSMPSLAGETILLNLNSWLWIRQVCLFAHICSKFNFRIHTIKLCFMFSHVGVYNVFLLNRQTNQEVTKLSCGSFYVTTLAFRVQWCLQTNRIHSTLTIITATYELVGTG